MKDDNDILKSTHAFFKYDTNYRVAIQINTYFDANSQCHS